MGWTGYQATKYKNGQIDRKAECDALFENGNVLKSAMVGSIYYAAVRYKDNKIGAVVIRTSVDKGEFYYKDMDETMNPYYYDCPASILKLLTPTDSEYALEWRKTCAEKQEQNKKKRANSKKEEIGTQYEVEINEDINFSDGFTLKQGSIVKVQKELFGNYKQAIYIVVNERGYLTRYRIKSTTFNKLKKKVIRYGYSDDK